jgi:hypothetical protein
MVIVVVIFYWYLQPQVLAVSLVNSYTSERRFQQAAPDRISQILPKDNEQKKDRCGTNTDTMLAPEMIFVFVPCHNHFQLELILYS